MKKLLTHSPTSYKPWMALNSFFLCWCAIKKLLTHHHHIYSRIQTVHSRGLQLVLWHSLMIDDKRSACHLNAVIHALQLRTCTAESKQFTPANSMSSCDVSQWLMTNMLHVVSVPWYWITMYLVKCWVLRAESLLSESEPMLMLVFDLLVCRRIWPIKISKTA